MLSSIVRLQQLDSADIDQRRHWIAERVLRESSAIRDINFSTINTRDLFELFAEYDGQFFEGQILGWMERPDHQMTFRLSSRMTSTGGMTTYRKRVGRNGKKIRHFEIAVSATLLFNTSFDQSAVKVGGVPVHHRLDALQRIFEHELVHLLEMMLWDDSSCAKPRFRSIVNRNFGHTESNHQLLTPAETARDEFQIEVGDRVLFHHQGKTRIGYVNRINRRATELVPDKTGEMFTDNKRYQRYYVPIEQLSKVEPSSQRQSAGP